MKIENADVHLSFESLLGWLCPTTLPLNLNDICEEILKNTLFFILNGSFSHDIYTKVLLAISNEHNVFKCEIFNKPKYNDKVYARKDSLKLDLVKIFGSIGKNK